VHIHHGFFETPDVPRALVEARPFGLAVDPETTTFFTGRETWYLPRTPFSGVGAPGFYMQLAANALSPARFYHLPPTGWWSWARSHDLKKANREWRIASREFTIPIRYSLLAPSSIQRINQRLQIGAFRQHGWIGWSGPRRPDGSAWRSGRRARCRRAFRAKRSVEMLCEQLASRMKPSFAATLAASRASLR